MATRVGPGVKKKGGEEDIVTRQGGKNKNETIRKVLPGKNGFTHRDKGPVEIEAQRGVWVAGVGGGGGGVGICRFTGGGCQRGLRARTNVRRSSPPARKSVVSSEGGAKNTK